MAAQISDVVAKTNATTMEAAGKISTAVKSALTKTSTTAQIALAEPAAKVAATGYSAKAKAFLVAHSIGLTLSGGIVLGIGLYYLANKLWFNREKAVEKSASEQVDQGATS